MPGFWPAGRLKKLLTMALKATICKAELAISDMDRHFYQTFNLTLAQHPSETTERIMVRLLAFAFNAHERLEFTRGLSTDDEPDLWQKNYSDDIDVWIELGQPDEKRIRKACSRARQVIVYGYHGRPAQMWWDSLKSVCGRFDNLKVVNLDSAATGQLVKLHQRGMRLQATIQDGLVWLGDENQSIEISSEVWK
jgi:uncharacterized protein YaeQ